MTSFQNQATEPGQNQDLYFEAWKNLWNVKHLKQIAILETLGTFSTENTEAQINTWNHQNQDMYLLKPSEQKRNHTNDHTKTEPNHSYQTKFYRKTRTKPKPKLEPKQN